MDGSKREEIAEMFQGILEKMKPDDEVKRMLTKDKQFLDTLSQEVVDKLIEQGLVEDKLLSVSEAMMILKIKTRPTLAKLKFRKKNPLQPVRMTENGRPKYRLSDINRYIKGLQTEKHL